MKTIKQKLILIVATFYLVIPGIVFAQANYSLNQNESKLIIHGTSTIHDWELPANKFTGVIEIDYVGQQTIHINNVEFSVVAESILSDNKIMDKKTHDALKADKNPLITFDFIGIQQQKGSEKQFSGEAEGKLTIAGSTKVVKIPFKGGKDTSGKIEVMGNVNLKMTDFGISPPTAMLGALKTGDDIKVDYKLVFVNGSGILTSEIIKH